MNTNNKQNELLGFEQLSEPDRELLCFAREAAAKAYAPYSNFGVGAAVMTSAGEIHVGANFENASYGISICAEIAALTAANTAGDRDVVALAVCGASLGGRQSPSFLVTPCGRCRQAIAELRHLNGHDIKVIASTPDMASILVSTIDRLLPYSFGPANLSAGPTRGPQHTF